MHTIHCRTFSLLLLILAAAGCGSTGPQKKAEITEDYFTPIPPALPLIQYVRSFNGSADFREKNALIDYISGTEKVKDYVLEKAFSVASTPGRLYVTDSFGAKGLNVFDLANRRFYILGKEPGVGQISKPINVYVDDDGLKYVSDLNRRLVLVFAKDDTYLKSYGTGQSIFPLACVVHGDEVFVLDAAKDKVGADDDGTPIEERRDQVVVFDKGSGKALRRIGRHGKGEEGFFFASHMAKDRLGNLYIADCENYRLVKMDREGNVVLSFGTHGDQRGEFARMKGIAVDPEGLIYIVDASFQRVQVFDSAGKFLFPFGGPQDPKAPMSLPAGIWIDDKNVDLFKDSIHPEFEVKYLIYVANQLSGLEHRIAVYAFGRRKGLDYSTLPAPEPLDRKPGKPLWKLPVLPPEPGVAPPPAPGKSAAPKSDS